MKQTFRRPIAGSKTRVFRRRSIATGQRVGQTSLSRYQQRLAQSTRERVALKRAAVKADSSLKSTLEKRGEMLERKIGRLQNTLSDQTPG